MRATNLFFPTLREVPADAEIASHQLMLRAGLIRRVAAGVYTWLPLGLRVLRRIERVVREELDRSGAQEIEMPVVQPAELWSESGRWQKYGPELLRIKDRHDRDFCLGPTHEEVVTDLVRREVQSYRQLPVNLYQIQTKFRDEPRPRFGVLRGREFLMKDGYSFHLTQECFDKTYREMYDCYGRILARLGLQYRAVLADSGNIGGDNSHEFHVLADAGEDRIAWCPESDYAANLERATTLAPEFRAPAPSEPMQKVATPGQHTIEDLCNFLNIPAETTVKTLAVRASEDSESNLVVLVLRGDHELNETKAAHLPGVASPLEFADTETIRAAFGCNPGSLAPTAGDALVYVDQWAAVLADFVAGSNEDDAHLTGCNWGRDFDPGTVADLRTVQAGDPSPDGAGPLEICRGIEAGHIFQLGTVYSEPMKAEALDADGRPTVMTMGCYGMGITRLAGAIIEQCHDDRGILWPEPVAPFNVVLVPVGADRSERVQNQAESIYRELQDAGASVLLDDRAERPGVKFADMDLIGIPHRIVISDRGLGAGTVEYKARASDTTEDLPVDGAVGVLLERLATA